MLRGTYPNQSRYNWAKWLIWANIFWSLISLCIEVYGLWLVSHVETASELSLNTFDSAAQTTSIIQSALLFISGLTFLHWWSKSRDNLERFGVVTTQNSNWATATWIVPIVSLWMPYQFTQEMSKTSGKTPPTLLPWWIAWLIATLSSRVAGRIFKQAETVSAFMHGLQVSVLSDIALIAAGMWLLPIMAAIHQRQSRLAAQQSAQRRAHLATSVQSELM